MKGFDTNKNNELDENERQNLLSYIHVSLILFIRLISLFLRIYLYTKTLQ